MPLHFQPGGQKVYFPRFVFTLLRTERRVKNQVVFKCPSVLNKFDIQQYLEKLYGLRVLQVNTMNYAPRRVRTGTLIEKIPGWKKAFVTIDHDFSFPEYKPPAYSA